MRDWLDGCAFALCLVVALGCGDDPPSFPRHRPDAAIECTPPRIDAGPPRDAGPLPDGAVAIDAGPVLPEMPCPDGEVCLQGRCYPPCATDFDCAQTEQCDEGVCTPRTRPRPDAGPLDAGSTDPCDGVTCEGATPACHPVNGMCVACLSLSQCGVGELCDVSRGVCRMVTPQPCSPCDGDAQCSGASCLMLDEDFERVCVVSCADGTACPTGLECEPGTNRCLPRVGSCTGYLAAVTSRSCLADEDCVPFGSAAAAGQCEGAIPPDTTGVCRQPCGLATDCPSDFTCTDGFCRPMPAM